MKKTRILCLLLTIAILMPLTVGCAAVKKPLEYFKDALERTFADSAFGEAAELLGEALFSGAVQVSFGGTDLFETNLSKADLTLYFAGDDQAAMADTTLQFGESKYDARLWLSNERILFDSDAFLGSTTLGIDLHTIEADLQNSIFRNNSGTVYANPSIDDSTASDIRTMVNSIFALYTSLEDRFDAFDELTDIFLAALTSHARLVHYTDDGMRFIDLTVDNSTLSRALRDTWEWAVDDRSFCRELREYATVLDAMQSAIDGSVSTKNINKVDAWLLHDAEIEALCTEIDGMAAFTFSLSTSIKKFSRKVLKLDASFKTEGSALALGFDLSTEEEASFYLMQNDAAHKLSLTKINDGFRSYSADFSYQSTGLAAFSANGSFSLDKKKDRYTLTANNGAGDYVISGAFLQESDDLTISIERACVNGEDKRFLLSLSLTADAEIPDAPDYVNWATITEQRFAPLSERMNAAKEQLLPNLTGLFPHTVTP